ncbi:MAG TPA: hypothetical protein PLZ95_22100, partial [Bryobacteraceae bacterium]|nr:hypothetical protein [Bryobacteraceae bacterium]
LSLDTLVREAMSRLYAVAVLAGITYSTLLASSSHAGPPAQSVATSSASAQNLKEFLRRYAEESNVDDDKTTRYASAFVDLNGDGQNEVVVFMIGGRWCGTGGCPTLILTPDGSSYRVVAEIFLTQTPIRVFNESWNGWRSIGVWVQGGAMQRGFEALLCFDGTTYPEDPFVLPARHARKGASGKVVIPSSQKAAPLYP